MPYVHTSYKIMWENQPDNTMQLPPKAEPPMDDDQYAQHHRD